MNAEALQASPHLTVRPAWLALHSEAAIDPGLPIIDAHHHIWDHAHNRYLPGDIEADVAAGHGIVATVFVECGAFYRTAGAPTLASLGETQYVNRVADTYAERPCRIAAAIVGNVSLLLGAKAGAVLDAHLAAAPARLRGIRNSSVHHADPAARGSSVNPPPGLLQDPEFRRGFACLAPRGLSFDAWLYHTQLGELLDLARAFPDTMIVLNHVGGPLGIGPYAGRREAVFEAWRTSMRALARSPNVMVKLGGMGMRMFGFDFASRKRPPDSAALAHAWEPYVLECIDAFGPERCMFQSNFPVDRGTTSYVILWNAFKRIAAPLGTDAKRALFLDTAARIYRISVPTQVSQ